MNWIFFQQISAHVLQLLLVYHEKSELLASQRVFFHTVNQDLQFLI